MTGAASSQRAGLENAVRLYGGASEGLLVKVGGRPVRYRAVRAN
ncbi:hypothetical protein [Streptomyces sp. NRRL WC-3725]|nr:hypothetical protein [Streptomyces sp. NRRL WC-3725]